MQNQTERKKEKKLINFSQYQLYKFNEYWPIYSLRIN